MGAEAEKSAIYIFSYSNIKTTSSLVKSRCFTKAVDHVSNEKMTHWTRFIVTSKARDKTFNDEIPTFFPLTVRPSPKDF